MSTDHLVTKLQSAKDTGDLEAYGRLRDELRGLGDDELRRLAGEAGVDGVDAMSHAQLVERLVEEPGATEA